jgi:hypothetical protein
VTLQSDSGRLRIRVFVALLFACIWHGVLDFHADLEHEHAGRRTPLQPATATLQTTKPRRRQY